MPQLCGWQGLCKGAIYRWWVARLSTALEQDSQQGGVQARTWWPISLSYRNSEASYFLIHPTMSCSNAHNLFSAVPWLLGATLNIVI